MNGLSGNWLHVEHAASFSFSVTKRTTVTSIHVQLSPKQEASMIKKLDEQKCLLWSHYCPGNNVLAADNIYGDRPPFVVAAFRLNATGEGTVSSLAWELVEGAIMSICLTSSSDSPQFAPMPGLHRRENEHSTPLVTPEINTTVKGQSEHLSSSMDAQFNIHITLLGTVNEAVLLQNTWRPLLCFRWFELKPYIREATFLALRHKSGELDEYTKEKNGGKKRPRTSETNERSRGVLQGDVKEAAGISNCGRYVLWRDGVLGLRGELVQYHRIYTPTREGKCVRVRRFPHRNADVVGTIPFGCQVEAIGRETDLFTGEHYALVLLSGDNESKIIAETYGLCSILQGKWIWGWSKIVGKNGMPFLTEVVDTTVISPDDSPIQRLQEMTYFTSVREDRSVRIRNGPSLSADVIGHLEPNEVKQAMRIHNVGAPLNVNSMSLMQQFVEWDDGGFSLLCNNEKIYLVPLKLQTELRHFPICP